VRLSEIKLFQPRTLTEALELLAKLERPRLLAGGTDLLVDLKEGLTQVKNLISLNAVDELKGIEESEGRIRIGALSTPHELAIHPLILRHLPSLSEAAGCMASPQVRSMATIGGNIASAVPSADLPPSLITADAVVELVCSDSPREMVLADFFKGPRETVCGAGEVLASVFIPVPPPETGMSYQRFVPREANALAVASVAARITLEKQRIVRAWIVLGAVAPIPLLASRASALLQGEMPSETLIAEASTLAAEESRPISDVRASLWFRTEILPVLARRALSEALFRARERICKEYPG
jgi:CO/xanthine dehydrogenase FAD-binding subunit